MAKRNKLIPARKQRDRSPDESLLVRSAETLGRMIGSLHRHLDSATRRQSETADDVMDSMPDIPRAGREDSRKGGTKRQKTSAPRKRAAHTRASSGRPTRGPRARAASRSSKKR